MKNNTAKAKDILLKERLTCVFCSDDKTVKCGERGIKPLIELIDNHKTLFGYCAADKVVGSAAAYLYTLLGVSEVYAPVMSENAVKILKADGITPYCDICTEVIINRQNTGICPMEQAVKECTNANQALAAVRKAVQMINSAE